MQLTIFNIVPPNMHKHIDYNFVYLYRNRTNNQNRYSRIYTKLELVINLNYDQVTSKIIFAVSHIVRNWLCPLPADIFRTSAAEKRYDLDR
jgi:hypothetical protein